MVSALTPLDLLQSRLDEKLKLASKVTLVFHGPFVFQYRMDGIDALVPSLDLHLACWGREPIRTAQDVVRRYPLERDKTYSVPGLRAAAKSPKFNRAQSLYLPKLTRNRTASSTLYATIQLPLPCAVRSLRRRLLLPAESYIVTAGAIMTEISGAEGKQETSRVQALQFETTPQKAIAAAEEVSVVHFHAEPLNEEWAKAAGAEHDLDGVAGLFNDLNLDLGPNFPGDLGASDSEGPKEWTSLLGKEGASHLRSLYETELGGTGTFNCDSWVPGC